MITSYFDDHRSRVTLSGIYIASCRVLHELTGREFTVGRNHTCDIAVLGDSLTCDINTISGQHFRIRQSHFQSCILRDESVNGTYVNNTLVGPGNEVNLKDNDKIAIVRPDIQVFMYVNKNEHIDKDSYREITSQFLIKKKLGEGGFGLVHLVIDKESYKPFAVKVATRPPNVSTSEWMKYGREASIVQTLEHPCVIRMHSCKVTDDKVFMKMEYMKGGDLTRWVNSRRLLSESQFKFLFYQLASAVQYIHQHHITHRDIKPGNILLDSINPNTLLKLTDFGIAKNEQLHSLMVSPTGTPQYMAPEVAYGQPYTNKVDVWSLGVLLYHGLSGTLPVRAQPNILKFPTHCWQGVSTGAMYLIKSMLTVRSEDRFNIEQVLKHPWLQDRNVLNVADEMMQAFRPSPYEPKLNIMEIETQRQINQTQMWTVVAGVAVIAIAGLILLRIMNE